MSDPKCPTCAVKMEIGFMIDRGDANAAKLAKWAGGEPERNWWQGLKLRGKEQIAIKSWRCPRCGLLQSYAIS